jgi:O-antigen/teichoic acid export membrane protein
MAGAAFLTKAPFEAYVVIWYVTDLGGDLFLWFLAWRELKRHNLLEGIRPTLRPTSLPGAWRFAININLTASITTVWGPIGRLVVGGLLGPAGAALFRVASSLADSAQKPADMLGKAFYPEIVRMDLSSKKPWRLMLRSTAVAGGIALAGVLILVVGGKSLLGLIFGKDFVGAYAPLMVLLAVPVLGVISFPLAPMLYALGRSDGPLKARLVGSIIFLVVIAPFALLFGVIGAALAYVIGNVAQLGLMILQVWQEYRRIRAPAPHAG